MNTYKLLRQRAVFNYSIPKKYVVSSNLINYRNESNPQVYLKVSKHGKDIGQMTFELYANHCPRTVENFKALCSGENNHNLTYKNSKFHRIINDFMAQGGDITAGNGTGGMSIWGSSFRDENLKLKHFKRGILSMANAGPDTNSSQFFITLSETSWLDGYHVVFGELIEGEDILKQIESVGTRSGSPKEEVKITDCGVVKH